MPAPPQEIEIGQVAGQEEDAFRGENLARTVPFDHHFPRADLDDQGLEARRDGAFLDAVLDVRPDPVLDGRAELGPPVHEGDLRPAPVEVEGRLGRGVLAADHDHRLAVELVRLRVVMGDVRQFLARYAELVGMIVAAAGDDHGPGAPRLHAAGVVRRSNREDIIVPAPNGSHRVAEVDGKVVGVDDAPVVAQRLVARRLPVRRDERQAADLQQIRRREEDHLAREMEQRVDQHALLEGAKVETGALGGDGGGQTGRPGADDDEIVD